MRESIAGRYNDDLRQFINKWCGDDVRAIAAAAANWHVLPTQYGARRSLLSLPEVAAQKTLWSTLDDKIATRRREIFQFKCRTLVKVLDAAHGKSIWQVAQPSIGDFALLPAGQEILSRPVLDSWVRTYKPHRVYTSLETEYAAAVATAAKSIDAWRTKIAAHLASLIRGNATTRRSRDDLALLAEPGSLFRCLACEDGQAYAFPALTRHACLNSSSGTQDEYLDGAYGVAASFEAWPAAERQLIPSIIKAIRPVSCDSAYELARSLVFVDPAGYFESRGDIADQAFFTSRAHRIGPYVRATGALTSQLTSLAFANGLVWQRLRAVHSRQAP